MPNFQTCMSNDDSQHISKMDHLKGFQRPPWIWGCLTPSVRCPGEKAKEKNTSESAWQLQPIPTKLGLKWLERMKANSNHHSLERQQITFQNIKSKKKCRSPFGMANIWHPKAASHSLAQNDHPWTSPRHVIRVDNMCDLSSWRMLRWRNAFWDQPTVAAENCQLYWEKLLYNFTNHL